MKLITLFGTVSMKWQRILVVIRDLTADKIDFFIKTSRIELNHDSWWSFNLNEYPQLSRFARIYLPVLTFIIYKFSINQLFNIK